MNGDDALQARRRLLRAERIELLERGLLCARNLSEDDRGRHNDSEEPCNASHARIMGQPCRV